MQQLGDVVPPAPFARAIPVVSLLVAALVFDTQAAISKPFGRVPRSCRLRLCCRRVRNFATRLGHLLPIFELIEDGKIVELPHVMAQTDATSAE